MIYALLPAAGHSTRMGRAKLALPLGGRTVLEHVIAALRAANVDHILVVLGPHVAELGMPAEAAGAHVQILGDATPDMRATAERGLRWLEERFHPKPEDSWLLVPSDHPTLQPEAVRQLLKGRKEHPARSIVVPTYQGKRGHPTLIAWKHVEAIRTAPVGQGINAYLRQQTEQTLEISVDSPEILIDLDTPEDYERLVQAWPATHPIT
jgi:molybdenum cofactor cytidylyltransferase